MVNDSKDSNDPNDKTGDIGRDGGATDADATARLDAAWLATLGVDELVPPSLAAWAPLVDEALLYFLDRLPAERLAAVLLAQFSLAEEASAAGRLVALFAQCPLLHKLGQVLARQPRLDPLLRAELQSLESMPASASLAPIVERLRDELGEALPVDIATSTLAEGSVAVVLPFTYRAPDGGLGHGVFKVLRPGVEQRVAEELAVLPELATFIERRAAELGLPRLDFRGTLASVARLLREEIRLDREQAHLAAAHAFYRDEPAIWVPRLLPWCSPHVTAMERVFGRKLNDADLSTAERRELAATAIRLLLAKPFWTATDPAVFHGDLHGGNLLVTADGRLAVLDWSLVARVAKPEREALLAIALGGLTLDAATVRRAIATLGSGADTDPARAVEATSTLAAGTAAALTAIVDRALDQLVLHGELPGFDWLLALLDELARAGAVAFGEDFALFRKSWLSLAGVVHDLAGPAAPDLPLIDAGLRQFLADWPARWFAPPGGRGFPGLVSNADLLGLAAASWTAPLRYGWRLQALALQALAAAGDDRAATDRAER